MRRLGVTAEDVQAAGRAVRGDVPTFAEYVPVVSAAVGSGARRAYEPYWRVVVEQWGDRRLDEVSAAEVSGLAGQRREAAVKRRNGRGGGGAAEHLVAALRCLYSRAVADGVVPAGCNPAGEVAKPRRPVPNGGRVLTDGELTEINTVVAETGDDPDLDVLLLRLHLETACTRGEALGLGTADLDVQRCVIVLRAGSADARTQPVSPSLAAALEQHVQWRPGPGPGLLRYRDGRCITARRYDHLWRRIGRDLPWVVEQQVSTGWFRRATLDRIGRRFGPGVAGAYVGSDVSRKALTGRGGQPIAGLAELAAVVAWLTCEPQPLAAGTAEPDPVWPGFD